MGPFFSRYDEKYELMDPKSSVHSKHKKMKKTTPKCIIFKLHKISNKDKILKATRGKGSKINLTEFSLKNDISQKIMKKHL